MSDNWSNRRMFKQEWKPLSGSRVVRYVAMPASRSVPGAEWTDDLPGYSEVENDMIGYVELPSNTHFDAYQEFEAFVRAVRDHGKMVSWRQDWAEKAREVSPTTDDEAADDEEAPAATDPDADSGDDGEATSDADESETADSEPDEAPPLDGFEGNGSTADVVEPDEPDDAESGPVTVVTKNGAGDRMLVDYDERDEPYTLPYDSEISDLRIGVLYKTRVVSIQPYGVFVAVVGSDDVSGLVHKSKLGLQKPGDFSEGEVVHAVVADIKENGDVEFDPHAAPEAKVIDDSLFTTRRSA